ncbi:MAG: T9SS type A sorting domain-containing protein [Bacteroidetes bacterium]|nr:T9SS type A sorting domain-containing protein [Bacteroidota bacterium]
MKIRIRPSYKLIWFLMCLGYFHAYSATWYVNDGFTTGDVFCSAAGSNATGNGSAAAPYLTVSYVISNQVLGADDIVYVDAGTYNERWMLNTNADGGTTGHPLSFIGAGISLSKNIVTGATEAIYLGASGNSYISIKNMYLETQNSGTNTVYIGTNVSNISIILCSIKTVSATCIHPYQANYITVQNCTLNTSGDGIRSNYCGNHLFAGNTITMTSKAAGNRCGIFIEGTTALGTANNCVIKSNKISGGNYGLDIQQQGTGNTWQNNYVWDCDYGLWADNGGETHSSNTFKFNSIRSDKDCIKGDFSAWTIKNNIFYLVGGTGYYCVKMNDASYDPSILDYNVYYFPATGGQAGYRGTDYATFANWDYLFNSNEANGYNGNPNFSSSTLLDITAGSSALDRASTDATVTDDVRRFPSFTRPSSAQDIGAFEYIATLPVELISFTASQSDMGNKLNWVTASEINNDYFTLERSFDGVTFFAFEDVKGAGNSFSPIMYISTDPLLTNKTTYYRLKQSDYDGTCTYSGIAVCATNNKSQALIYPNPTEGRTKLFFNAEENDSFSLVIYDCTGKSVCAAKLFVKKGENNFDINLADLAAGNYYLTITSLNSFFTTKFVKY